MKQFYPAVMVRYYSSLLVFSAFVAGHSNTADAQSCPLNTSKSINSYPNTYYPASQNIASGSFSIILGAATYGSTSVSPGDVLLVIQMQGAQINSTNTANYGDGTGTGSGYLGNGALMAGRMEFVLAANSVPLSGGTLNVVSGLVNSYQSTPFGTDGQYTYQVIRVPLYYDLTLTGNVTAPRWNGATGGVIVLYATNNINMGGYSIDASGLGFRGGGGRAFRGAGSGSNADFITTASNNANGGKGEGIAGTPKYLNNNNTFLDVSSYEGYPNGSYGKGAPGNAGGGGTDGDPANNNDENTGGGGGGNGGPGGQGGNSWNSNIASGGRSGAIFSQASPSRLIMGGGGGAGTTNDGTGDPGNTGFYSSGYAGGGIIILSANAIKGSGTVKANGGGGNILVKNDGAGGGGAGGSILIFSKTGNLSNITAIARGGTGNSNEFTSGPAHGPGGGGGGGVIYSNMTLNASSSVTGGSAGTTAAHTTNYGATAGAAGIIAQNIAQSQIAAFPINCSVLSVEFLDLAAIRNEGINTLTWRVAGETNTLEYVIERSNEGSSFTGIGHVPYQVGTSSINQYTFSDNGVTSTGTVYYRIREASASGNNSYSKVIALRMEGLASQLTVFPNPAKTSATVSFVAVASGDVSLRLFDLKGSQVWQKQLTISAGANSVVLDQLGSIPNGLYLLQWSDGRKPQQVKLIVNH